MKVMVSGSITEDSMSKIKIDPCGVCSLRVKANVAMYLQCGKWIIGRCARVKRLTPKFSINSTCKKCKANIGDTVEQEEKSCDEVESVREFTYLGDRVSAGGGSEASVTARTRCGWISVGSEVSWCMTGDFS